MNKERRDKLLELLDGNNEDQDICAISELRTSLGNSLPTVLLEKYRRSRKYPARVSCVYYSIRYSRICEDAVQLGIEALEDRSKVVRYRSCMLLAYSLNKLALAPLRNIVENSSCEETRSHAIAAIDAIENKNHNYFVDRKHTGKITFSVDKRL